MVVWPVHVILEDPPVWTVGPGSVHAGSSSQGDSVTLHKPEAMFQHLTI